jgi:hypothetical protein
MGTLLLLFIKISFIENETAAFEFLQDRPEGAILQIINTLKYFSIPFVYLWKFTVIAFVIWIGCFMYGYRVTYSQCWGVVIGAEFIFLIPKSSRSYGLWRFRPTPPTMRSALFTPWPSSTW